MLDQKFYVLNDDFNVARDPRDVRTPLWAIQKARTSPAACKTMQDSLRAQIKQAPDNSTLILSSEVLGPASRKGMFAGFDDIADVEVVAYFRPQIDWIPSAWKQWESREGVTLQDATAKYITEHRPPYRQMIDNWEASLPKAKVTLRLFARGALVKDDPFEDFLTQIGFEYDSVKSLPETTNPSIDYALLHLMMRHHDLFFKTRHDSALMAQFVKILPEQYLQTNAPMLNARMADDITEAFRADNMAMLTRCVAPDQVQAMFDTYFARPAVPAGTAYPDFTESQILTRAADILGETLGLKAENVQKNSRALAQALHQTLTSH